jgi:hypothetical protein
VWRFAGIAACHASQKVTVPEFPVTSGMGRSLKGEGEDTQTTVSHAGAMKGNKGRKGRSRKGKGEDEQNMWSQKIGVASVAEDWFESMMNSACEASSGHANDIQLGQL